jgi:hypothetical protein
MPTMAKTQTTTNLRTSPIISFLLFQLSHVPRDLRENNARLVLRQLYHFQVDLASVFPVSPVILVRSVRNLLWYHWWQCILRHGKVDGNDVHGDKGA